MTRIQSNSALAAIVLASVAAAAGAATDGQHDSHHPASAPAVQMAQAKPGMASSGVPGMQGMQGLEAQMKAMQEMHAKMMAAGDAPHEFPVAKSPVSPSRCMTCRSTSPFGCNA